MTTRAAELPALDSVYPLTADQVARYRQDGHVRLSRVASADEVDAYRPVFAGEVERRRDGIKPLAERDTYGKAFLQVMNLWRAGPRAARFVTARRFARIAAELMGVSGVRLYHDQALFKEARGGHTPWHQDQFYWPLDTDRTVTMWMPLVDVTPDMGPMLFASGSHREGNIGKLAISDRSEEVFRTHVTDKGYTVTEAAGMRAGDATFHAGWTLHRAPANDTDRTREVMTVIYFADGAKVGEADHPNRVNDLEQWLPGCKPGGLAASPLNPLLYSA